MPQAVHNKAPKKAQEVDRLSMPESQSSEMAEIVQTIQKTEQGQINYKKYCFNWSIRSMTKLVVCKHNVGQ